MLCDLDNSDDLTSPHFPQNPTRYNVLSRSNPKTLNWSWYQYDLEYFIVIMESIVLAHIHPGTEALRARENFILERQALKTHYSAELLDAIQSMQVANTSFRSKWKDALSMAQEIIPLAEAQLNKPGTPIRPPSRVKRSELADKSKDKMFFLAPFNTAGDNTAQRATRGNKTKTNSHVVNISSSDEEGASVRRPPKRPYNQEQAGPRTKQKRPRKDWDLWTCQQMREDLERRDILLICVKGKEDGHECFDIRTLE
jgi:hypothetical protein